MFEGCRLDDFSVEDILKPTANRVRMLFSAVLNFLKFKEDFQRKALSIKGESQSLFDELQLIHAKNENLEMQLQALTCVP